MKEVQRVAIVDPSDATREPLRNLLLGVESIWLEAECSRYEFFGDVARQSLPDLVVVALDALERLEELVHLRLQMDELHEGGEEVAHQGVLFFATSKRRRTSSRNSLMSPN